MRWAYEDEIDFEYLKKYCMVYISNHKDENGNKQRKNKNKNVV